MGVGSGRNILRTKERKSELISHVKSLKCNLFEESCNNRVFFCFVLDSFNRPIANLARLGHLRSKVNRRSIEIRLGISSVYFVKVLSLNVSKIT